MITRLLFILTLSCLSFQGWTQRDKEFQIRLGAGAGAYSTNTEWHYSIDFMGYPVKGHYSDNGSASTVHFPLELRYEISERFNVGLDTRFGTYLYEDNENNTQSNAFRFIGLGVEFTLMNREHSRLYVGAGVGSTYLEMREKITPERNSDDVKIKWRGPGYKMNLGFMKFFGTGPIGINFNIGVVGHVFDLKEVELPALSLNGLDGTLKAGGVDLNLGIVFRIPQ
jgi:hypothetical protein